MFVPCGLVKARWSILLYIRVSSLPSPTDSTMATPTVNESTKWYYSRQSLLVCVITKEGLKVMKKAKTHEGKHEFVQNWQRFLKHLALQYMTLYQVHGQLVKTL